MGDHLCCGAPPELNVRRLQKGDRFLVQMVDLPVVTERCFLVDGKGLCTDDRVRGFCARFIALMAQYLTSIVTLRRLEPARL